MEVTPLLHGNCTDSDLETVLVRRQTKCTDIYYFQLYRTVIFPNKIIDCIKSLDK